MCEADFVGAVIRNAEGRIYVHRRSGARRFLPKVWDIVGGARELGESVEQALAREIAEETGWTLRRVGDLIADWEWQDSGSTHRELDYLVEVEGDLSKPRLEETKHDVYSWVGLDNLELLVENRAEGDRRLRDIVAGVLGSADDRR